MPSDLKRGKQNLALLGWWFMEEHWAGNGQGSGGREGRQESMGFHSQPIKAATCTLTRDHIPRYISSCEGYCAWYPSLGRNGGIAGTTAAFGMLSRCGDGPRLGQHWFCKNHGLCMAHPSLWLSRGPATSDLWLTTFQKAVSFFCLMTPKICYLHESSKTEACLNCPLPPQLLPQNP